MRRAVAYPSMASRRIVREGGEECRRRARLGLAVLPVVLGIAGCGSVTTSAEVPQPTGKAPSEIARMVCTTKAAGEIAQVVGAKASVTAPDLG